MPNIPATISAWITLAPERLRPRKIRSGISGVSAVASRMRNPASSTSEVAPKPRVWAEPQPLLAASTIA